MALFTGRFICSGQSENLNPLAAGLFEYSAEYICRSARSDDVVNQHDVRWRGIHALKTVSQILPAPGCAEVNLIPGVYAFMQNVISYRDI